MVHIWALGKNMAMCGERMPKIALSPSRAGTVTYRSLCQECAVHWLHGHINEWAESERTANTQVRVSECTISGDFTHEITASER